MQVDEMRTHVRERLEEEERNAGIPVGTWRDVDAEVWRALVQGGRIARARREELAGRAELGGPVQL
jgi:hypothetical protein